MTPLQSSLLYLVRLGLGIEKPGIPMTSSVAASVIADSGREAPKLDRALYNMALEQGVQAIALDGATRLLEGKNPPEIDPVVKKMWPAAVLHDEVMASLHQSESCRMGQLFEKNGIRTYVLKGAVVAECYPNPVHRPSADLDCFLLPIDGNQPAAPATANPAAQTAPSEPSAPAAQTAPAEPAPQAQPAAPATVWELGNSIIEKTGVKVERDFYKNSTFFLHGLMVENHRFLTPFRGNPRLESLERHLQSLLKADEGNDIIESTCLCRPPVMVTALFLVEHACSHFLHEGLTWRLILDWMMFSRRHQDDIDWPEFNRRIDEFGFRRFYDSYVQLGAFLLGEVSEEDLSKADQKMLSDVWAPLDLHETLRGFKGKLNLAGNTVRARWKYRLFSEFSMPRALWIQVKGFFFIRHPQIDETPCLNPYFSSTAPTGRV